MGLILLYLYKKNGKIPYIYDSWLVYAEIFVASVVNMTAMNITTIANQNANPGTVNLFMFVGVI